MNLQRNACLLVIVLFSIFSFGAEESATKEKDNKFVEHQRGWIGGEYKLARRHWNWFNTTEAVYAFPKSLTDAQNAGILITALNTNTPAYVAGLREADLILQLDHKKITSLTDFRRKIDQTKPGVSLTIVAYRNGELNDYNLTAGCETFREQGMFGFGLPFGLPATNLKFNPSFSLIALKLACETIKHTELDSAKKIL